MEVLDTMDHAPVVRHWQEDYRFTTPPARSWIRGRYLPRIARRGGIHPEAPEWEGMWHLTTGDHRCWPRPDAPRFTRYSATVACGHTLDLARFAWDGQMVHDYVKADEQPEVDACRRCLRAAEQPDVTLPGPTR